MIRKFGKKALPENLPSSPLLRKEAGGEAVKPKKYLGQHFLKDLNIAQQIVDALTCEEAKKVIEIGPGMGVLTQFLIKRNGIDLSVVEVDGESIVYLRKHSPQLHIIHQDFLKLEFETISKVPIAIIGNFPYNISSQILFKVLENRDQVKEVVGMFQKEVGERMQAKARTKAYGILSVLVQAFYDVEYLFTVHENVFNPPPKVKSAVLRFKRNQTKSLNCDEKLFVDIVKTGFNQRRKTLRNALKKFELPVSITASDVFNKRAEELSVNDFVELANLIEKRSN
jgi:16S rRNA (adenine1518-N6/adenine1519-N6)-dimethyltransferase